MEKYIKIGGRWRIAPAGEVNPINPPEHSFQVNQTGAVAGPGIAKPADPKRRAAVIAELKMAGMNRLMAETNAA